MQTPLFEPAGITTEAMETVDRTLDKRDERSGTMAFHHTLVALIMLGEFNQAESVVRSNVERTTRLLDANEVLAAKLKCAGRLDESRDIFLREVLPVRTRLFGRDHRADTRARAASLAKAKLLASPLHGR